MIDTKKIMEMYDICRQTVYRWRIEGLPYHEKGRYILFQKDKVEKWILSNKNKVPASEEGAMMNKIEKGEECLIECLDSLKRVSLDLDNKYHYEFYVRGIELLIRIKTLYIKIQRLSNEKALLDMDKVAVLWLKYSRLVHNTEFDNYKIKECV